MFKSETKRRMKALGILFMLIGTFTTFLNLNLSDFKVNDTRNNEEVSDKSKIFNFQDMELKTSDVPTSFENSGENINITLHQSYLNNSFNTVLNASDPKNSTIILPCPKEPTFNSSFVNITINDIYAPDKTLVVEPNNVSGRVLSFPHYTSFTVPSSSYLTGVNVSLYATTSGATFTFDVYGAKYENNYIRPDTTKDLTGPGVYLGQIFNDTGGSHSIWIKLDSINQLLNTSSTKTYNNTFFIWIQSDDVFSSEWYGDNVGDDTLSYNNPSNDPINFDLSLIVDIEPLSNNPKPKQIGLKINDEDVKNIADGKGYWNSSDELSDLDGTLDFNITADWWDVICNISHVQINFTKTDLQATSKFTVKYGTYVSWNVSIVQTIDTYDNRIKSFNTINFTIPSTWDNNYIYVYNGSDLKTAKVSPIVKDGFREVQVLGAGNGTNWYLTANSTNLLNSIKCFVNSIEVNYANYSNKLSFNSTFKEIISNGEINLSVYSPSPHYLNHTNLNTTFTPNSEISLGSWDISNNITEYGKFLIQVYWFNNTAAGLMERNITIFAETNLSIIDPPDKFSFEDNIKFNITVYFEDIGFNEGISGLPSDIISENSTKSLSIYSNATLGYYFIEINTTDFEWGWNYIEINASKTYYNNQSIVFSFQKIINTNIFPSNTIDFGNIIRGKNATYTFNYSDILNRPIIGANIVQVDLPSGFIWDWDEVTGSPGNYSIELDTTNVEASESKYICNFSISAIGNESQNIHLELKVIMAQTAIDIQDYNITLIRKDHLNQTVIFYYNDTDNNGIITGLTANTVFVKDNQTGASRSKWLYTTGTPGLYKLNISTSGLNSGWIRFELNISLPPNYTQSISYIDFYLRGNFTQIPQISLSDPGGQGILTPMANNYSIFEERDLYVEFNITDTDDNNELIKSEVDSYLIEYFEIGNTTNQGILTEDLSFDANTNSFKGYISTTELPKIGSYTLTLRVSKVNYEEADISFNLIIKARYDVELSIVSKPDEITAGDTFKIVLKAQYDNGTLMPLVDANIILIPYFDDLAQESKTKSTNDTGEVLFEITVSRTARNISLNIQLEGDYYHLDTSLQITDITVNPPPGGLTFKDLMPYLIIIGAAIAVVGASLGVYRGVVVPKKREKARVLTEVKTIFDDAINLEHVLVLHKGTGTCIYFKSFGSEAIDPELISGFISAISSFGKDLVSQEELNEISYGDKMLLLSDGEFIRIALVLSKKASIILRKNLKDLIIAFERKYENELPKWRGQLNIFREADTLIDDSLNTSIILPHEITYEFSTIKALKISHSRDVLKIANGLIKDSERNFFFIATLLKEASEKSSKDTAEIFMGIKELRDKKILMPIEISAIEAPPISQQEINLINQKVAGLVDLSPEEKQKLVNDLAQMGPAEREAYFASLAEQKEIISAPIETKPGAALIENMKDAKKEIAKLKKIAKDAKKKNDYENAIKINQNAAQIALNWELSREFTILDDTIRKIKIEDLKIKLKDLENEAKNAAKEDNYKEAAQKYKMSSKIASEIFKLGVTDMTKEVKRLSNKSKEYEKLV